jgi:CheY-like chemotaxis protein
MCDIVFYLGSDIHDFSVISAAFKQLAQPVELHFVTAPENIFDRLNSALPLPSLIFAKLPPETAPVLEFLQHLKSHPTGRWIPVVLIGSEANDWQYREASSAGAAALLKSPLQIDALQRLLSASGDLIFRPLEDAPTLANPML